MYRLYENDDIVVFWNSEKCFHSKRCVHGSSRVFNPNRKPWINLEEADNKEIWQAISQCPSGALGCLYKHGVEVTFDEEGCRSVATFEGREIGECNYKVSESGWNIYHTGVIKDFEGKGIAKRLVYKVIEAAEKNCAEISATCSYAKSILEQ